MNIQRLIQALVDAGADFVIIGGWSAILHGSRHMTDDLDITFSRVPENLKRLVQALAPFHPRLRGLPSQLPFLWEVATLRNSTTTTLDTDLGAIDLLAEVSGLGSYAEILAASPVAEAFERKVHILCLKHLIAAKRAAGRDKDLRVLPELESLLEAQQE